jgi:hypothetical protein
MWRWIGFAVIVLAVLLGWPTPTQIYDIAGVTDMKAVCKLQCLLFVMGVSEDF